MLKKNLFLYVLMLVPQLAFSQINSLGSIWPKQDKLGQGKAFFLIVNRNIRNEVEGFDAQQLAKQCEVGLRVISKGSFVEPLTLVILKDYKTNQTNRYPINAWREYWSADRSALTVHRTTHFLELDEGDIVKNTIEKSLLWEMKDQKIKKKNRVVDGLTVTVELYKGGQVKILKYKRLPGVKNKGTQKFNEALAKLINDLGLSAEGFAFLK